MARLVDRVAFALLLLLIAWLPIPYGSNRPWAWALMQLAVFAILALWLLARVLDARRVPPAVAVLVAAGAFLLLALLYAAAQALPLPLPLLESLSPRTHALYAPVLAETTGAAVAPLSIDAGTTLAECLKWAAYLALLLLVAALVDSRARVLALCVTLVLVGAAEALFGIFVWQFDIQYVPLSLRGGLRVVGGTFVNRNHFGAHLVMTAALALGLLPAALHSGASRYGDYGHRRDLWTGPAPLLLLALAAMFAGLVLSRSRGAILALALALAAVMALAVVRRGRRAPELRLLPWLGAGALAILLATGPRSVLSRFFRQSLVADERLAQWQLSLQMVADFPLFGIGAGNYVWLFSSYRDGSLRGNLLYDHAHSDYLETLIELGFVGSALLAVGVALLLAKIAAGYLNRHDPLLRGVLFGALTGMLAMLVHAAVEFNFRIPANAAYFFVLAGLGVAAATLPRRAE